MKSTRINALVGGFEYLKSEESWQGHFSFCLLTVHTYQYITHTRIHYIILWFGSIPSWFLKEVSPWRGIHSPSRILQRAVVTRNGLPGPWTLGVGFPSPSLSASLQWIVNCLPDLHTTVPHPHRMSRSLPTPPLRPGNVPGRTVHVALTSWQAPPREGTGHPTLPSARGASPPLCLVCTTFGFLRFHESWTYYGSLKQNWTLCIVHYGK